MSASYSGGDALSFKRCHSLAFFGPEPPPFFFPFFSMDSILLFLEHYPPLNFVHSPPSIPLQSYSSPPTLLQSKIPYSSSKFLIIQYFFSFSISDQSASKSRLRLSLIIIIKIMQDCGTSTSCFVKDLRQFEVSLILRYFTPREQFLLANRLNRYWLKEVLRPYVRKDFRFYNELP